MIFRLMGACSFEDGLVDVASGTTTQIVSADATVTPARIANRPRQPPLQSSNTSAGEVALNAPRAPSMTIQPFMAATRSFGNHRGGIGRIDAERLDRIDGLQHPLD